MSVQAFVLIQTEVGKATEVARAVGRVGGVISSADVTGPYDVIVQAEADSIDALGQLVLSQIQQIGGITRTLTCPVVNLH